MDTDVVGAGAGAVVQGTGGIGILIGARRIFGTETVISVGMGVRAETGTTGMIEMVAEEDTVVPGGAGAQSGKAVKNAEPGLNNGTERGRRSSEGDRAALFLMGQVF